MIRGVEEKRAVSCLEGIAVSPWGLQGNKMSVFPCLPARLCRVHFQSSAESNKRQTRGEAELSELWQQRGFLIKHSGGAGSPNVLVLIFLFKQNCSSSPCCSKLVFGGALRDSVCCQFIVAICKKLKEQNKNKNMNLCLSRRGEILCKQQILHSFTCSFLRINWKSQSLLRAETWFGSSYGFPPSFYCLTAFAVFTHYC